jgi:hypothetical protein
MGQIPVVWNNHRAINTRSGPGKFNAASNIQAKGIPCFLCSQGRTWALVQTKLPFLSTWLATSTDKSRLHVLDSYTDWKKQPFEIYLEVCDSDVPSREVLHKERH